MTASCSKASNSTGKTRTDSSSSLSVTDRNRLHCVVSEQLLVWFLPACAHGTGTCGTHGYPSHQRRWFLVGSPSFGRRQHRARSTHLVTSSPLTPHAAAFATGTCLWAATATRDVWSSRRCWGGRRTCKNSSTPPPPPQATDQLLALLDDTTAREGGRRIVFPLVSRQSSREFSWLPFG